MNAKRLTDREIAEKAMLLERHGAWIEETLRHTTDCRMVPCVPRRFTLKTKRHGVMLLRGEGGTTTARDALNNLRKLK